MRLGTLITEQLRPSRKVLKRLFLRGVVKVDGQVEYNEARNVDSQLHTIEVEGKILQTSEVYYLLNKPAGVVTANKDRGL